MTMNFESWTAYDAWLIENYDAYSVYKIDEADGALTIEYCARGEFHAAQATADGQGGGAS